MNSSFFRSLAQAFLSSTTRADGKSSLPDWLASLLAVAAAGPINNDEQEKTWADDTLIRKAIGLHRAVETRRAAGQAASTWQFSADGLQAVQVLPQPTDAA